MDVPDDSDKVGTDVVLLHGCPQICMPNPVNSFLEVYEDMVDSTLLDRKEGGGCSTITEEWEVS